MRILMAAGMAFFLAGCATELTAGAERLQLISAEQKVGCERLKLVTFNQRVGPDKPNNALKGAMNEAAAAGADSLYIISTASDPFTGASIAGEAMRCKK